MKGIFEIPAKLVTVSKGSFYCKSCFQSARYRLVEKVERRMVFFVPIDGDVIEKFLECENCKNRCPVDYLRATPTDDLKIVAALKERLVNGQSIQHVEEKLRQTGVDDGLVREYLRVAVGISRKLCPQCRSTYHSSASRCEKCGVPLPSTAA